MTVETVDVLPQLELQEKSSLPVIPGYKRILAATGTMALMTVACRVGNVELISDGCLVVSALLVGGVLAANTYIFHNIRIEGLGKDRSINKGHDHLGQPERRYK